MSECPARPHNLLYSSVFLLGHFSHDAEKAFPIVQQHTDFLKTPNNSFLHNPFSCAK